MKLKKQKNQDDPYFIQSFIKRFSELEPRPSYLMFDKNIFLIMHKINLIFLIKQQNYTFAKKASARGLRLDTSNNPATITRW